MNLPNYRPEDIKLNVLGTMEDSEVGKEILSEVTDRSAEEDRINERIKGLKKLMENPKITVKTYRNYECRIYNLKQFLKNNYYL